MKAKLLLVAVSLALACSNSPLRQPPPSCAAGSTSCDGRCADTSSDPHDCGACGHDCLGGACNRGACAPVTFFDSASTFPAEVAVDRTNVYFTTVTEGAVYSCPKLSCALGQPVALANNQSLARPVASDGKNVYWSVGFPDEIRRCPTTGCGAGPTTIASHQDSFAIVVANRRVWWSSWTGTPGGNTVMWCDVDSPCNPNRFAGDQIGGWGLWIGDTDVFWTDAPAMPSSGGTPLGSVHACAIGDACVQDRTIAQGLDLPSSIVSDGVNVYWTNRGSGTVTFCPVSGCAGPPRTLWATGCYDCYDGIALDAAYVYFGGTAGFFRCPKSGCGDAPAILAQSSRVGKIAVDDVAIYWTDMVRGTVSRLAK